MKSQEQRKQHSLNSSRGQIVSLNVNMATGEFRLVWKVKRHWLPFLYQYHMIRGRMAGKLEFEAMVPAEFQRLYGELA